MEPDLKSDPRIQELAEKLRITLDEAQALVSDPTRAPAIYASVAAALAISDEYDDDGPMGLQLFIRGILTEDSAKLLDGVE